MSIENYLAQLSENELDIRCRQLQSRVQIGSPRVKKVCCFLTIYCCSRYLSWFVQYLSIGPLRSFVEDCAWSFFYSKTHMAILISYINSMRGHRRSSMDPSAPTILQPWVQIPCKTRALFLICILIGTSNGQKLTKRGRHWPKLKTKTVSFYLKSMLENWNSKNSPF